jgi:hypothetical protein
MMAFLRLGLYGVMLVSACAPTVPTQCTSEVPAADISRATALINAFLVQNYGVPTGSLNSTYLVHEASECGSLLTLVLWPDVEHGVLGGTSEYSVDLKTSAVTLLTSSD